MGLLKRALAIPDRLVSLAWCTATKRKTWGQLRILGKVGSRSLRGGSRSLRGRLKIPEGLAQDPWKGVEVPEGVARDPREGRLKIPDRGGSRSLDGSAQGP